MRFAVSQRETPAIWALDFERRPLVERLQPGQLPTSPPLPFPLIAAYQILASPPANGAVHIYVRRNVQPDQILLQTRSLM